MLATGDGAEVSAGRGRTQLEWASRTAPELRRIAASGAIAILPVASTEQHGPHLPVQVDSLLCNEVACRAAAMLGPEKAIVLPTVWSGLADHHMSLGGTVTLDFATFSALIGCIVRSLARQGFQRIFVLNGHGGNRAAMQTVVAELGSTLGVPIATGTYWELAPERFAAILENQVSVQHACEAETSMVLALRPDLVKLDRIAEAKGPDDPARDRLPGRGVYRWRDYSRRTTSGVIGDAKSATAEKGQLLLVAAATALAEALSAERLWEMPS